MSWNEEQGHGEKVQRGWERERDELRREIEATRRTAGYLAVMVRARDPRTSDYAAEILDTPEIAEALKAAGGACPANCANGWRPIGDLPCPRCNADGTRPRPASNRPASPEGSR